MASSAAAKQLTLQEIVSELTEVTEWHQLGVQLEVPVVTLQTIESNHPNDAQRRKTEVLIWWFQNSLEISWEKLAQAVEAVGGHATVVKRLRLKMNPTPKDNQQELSPSHNHFHFMGLHDEVNQAITPTVGQIFKETVEKFPMHPALKHKEDETWKTITYTEYYNLCIKAAKSFLKLGLEPNHAVAIIGFNSPEWVISALGAMFAGGLPTGIFTPNNPEVCHFLADSSQANIIVVENEKEREKILQGKVAVKEVKEHLPHLKAIVQYKGKLSQEYSDVYEWEEFLKLGDEIETSAVKENIESQEPNHCAVLTYTSGTTDAPKGVMLSHKNLTFSAKALVQTYGRLEYGKEVGVSYLPLSHIAAQMADIYLPLVLGATVYFAEPDALKGSLRKTLREVQPTFFFGVPRVYEKMMEHLQELGSSISGVKRVISTWAKKKGRKGNENRQKNQSLPWGWAFAKQMVFKKVRVALGFQHCKIFAVGAAPMRKDVHDYFMSINIPLMELYGMSECSGCHTINLHHNHNGWRVGSCGKPIQGVDLKIVDPGDNRERKEGEEGEICISGPHVFLGYLKNEEKTSEAIDDDKWLHSRDIGKIQDGFLYITGRIKAQQMIQTFGSQNTRISEIIAQEDRAVFTAIQKGVNRVNERATSQAQKVQKWTLLTSDFSISGGELGPTLKVRRHVVQKEYETTIEDMYSESSTPHQSDVLRSVQVEKWDSEVSIPREELESQSSIVHPTAEEHSVGEPQVELTIGDLVQVTDYLLGLQHIDIYNLGLTLGLYYPHLNKMETSKRFRDDVIAAWLQKEDQVLKMGTPTWETLVKALRDPRVNQTGVASKIAADKNVTK